MSNAKRFATSEPTICGVCRRHAWHIGYAPRQNSPVMWLCDSNECHAAAREVYKMPAPKLDLYEQQAAESAGAEAGAYLDEIGNTDLAALSGEQFNEFLRRVIVGFETNLRTKILSGAPPF